MYPPSPFAHPVSSFQFPVDPPTVDPGDEPTSTICVNSTWLPYIAGALKQLLLQSTWNVADDTELQLVQSRVFDLISQFQQPTAYGCGVLTPELLCISGDFRDALYGSSSDPAQPCTMGYDNVVGWQSCDDSSLTKSVLSIQHTLSQSTFVRSYRIVGTAPAIQPSTITLKAYLSGTQVATTTIAHTAGAGVDVTWDCEVQADAIIATIVPDDNTKFLAYTWQAWELCYTGDFPLFNVVNTWEHIFDFTASDGGFSLRSLHSEDPFNTYTPDTMGVYTSSTGWQDTQSTVGSSYQNDGVHLQKSLGSSRIVTGIDVTFDRAVSLSGPSTIVYIQGKAGGTVVFTQASSSPGPTGTAIVYSWAGSQLIDELFFTTNCGECGGSCTPDGSVTVTSVRVRGIGSDPF